jgi:hypothetical protein
MMMTKIKKLLVALNVNDNMTMLHTANSTFVCDSG